MNQVAMLNNKPLFARLPKDRIVMTKYYVHKAKVSDKPTAAYPLPLYALPQDEAHLTLEEANTKPGLTRFQFGKQAILKGALKSSKVPVLAYLSREDLEAALLQGTLVADFVSNKHQVKIFNVDRNNNIAYDKTKNPYLQERFWYFKSVAGIKGYGKDANYKITVNPQVTFAADLQQFGLGKLLLVQYPNQAGAIVTRMGILADTGGAFQNNQYQVDFLTGSYAGRDAFNKANQKVPDYVTAYFMVLKK
jgi:3D (Asp-Asp-Asp) domain-containing protein